MPESANERNEGEKKFYIFTIKGRRRRLIPLSGKRSEGIVHLVVGRKKGVN